MAQDGQYDGPELVLRLDNRIPIKAAQFARLLRDLASDYKRLYGEDLIIVGVPEGSLTAKLRALSKFAQEANHILDFGTKLATIFGAGAVGVAAVATLAHGPSTPLKAAQTLAAIAAESGSHLELKYVTADKQEILIRVTPQEARQVQRLASHVAKERKANAPPLPLPTYREHALPLSSSVVDVSQTLKSQLAYLAGQEGGLRDLSPATRSLIVALVVALQAASPYRVTQLIMDLEAEGNFAAAGLLREIINGTGGGGTFARIGGG